MSYDDWKCSPPCPECGDPNCLCYDILDEPEESMIAADDCAECGKEHGHHGWCVFGSGPQ